MASKATTGSLTVVNPVVWAMGNTERLPTPMFRLPDGSIATLEHVDQDSNQVAGTRTLRSGHVVRFTATLTAWSKIDKTRVGDT